MGPQEPKSTGDETETASALPRRDAGAAAWAASLNGRQIGPYRILGQLGSGGMGVVCVAERADAQYRQRVAIKLVRPNMDVESILNRFRHERQILANLDHPNICRLLDGGTTPDGLPYFVMEYIEGQPIETYCDNNKLPIRERLHLFRQVCSAVQYAHQNLVIHRDIKPGNILVTAQGVPKLLDFGIAKLLNPGFAADGGLPTVVFGHAMTPEYASPEQVRGDPITTASDIYSLGVLLYELLTGHLPHRLHSRTQKEIERAVCEEEPPRPSQAVTRPETIPAVAGRSQVTITPETVSRTREGQPEKLRKKLAGDLDNIVLMALRKEPRRRYASVEHLSEDIRRHLQGMPVSARKDTVWYRTGKFVQRNKLGVAAAVAILTLIVGSAMTAQIQAMRIQKERDKAQQVTQFLVESFRVADPGESRGNTVTAREILDRGVAKIRRELRGQPEVQATLMDTMGTVYVSLGLYDTAERLYEQALALRRGEFGPENPWVASSLNNLGDLLRVKGDYARAEPLLRESLAIERKLMGQEHPDVAATLNNLGLILSDKGDFRGGESLFRESLAIRRKLFGEDDLQVAASLNNLAILLHAKGDYAAAEPLLRQSLAITRERLGNDHPDVASILNTLGLLLDTKGDGKGAEAAYRESLALRRKLLGNEHPDVATSLNNLALLLSTRGDVDDAEPLYRQALAIHIRLMGEEHTQVAKDRNNLALLLQKKGDRVQAEQEFRQALAILRKALGEENADTARAMHNLAAVLHDMGRLAEAGPLYREGLRIRRKTLPAGHFEIAVSLLGLGRLMIDLGDARGAEPLLREAVAIQRKAMPAGHWRIADAESALGGCLTALGRYAEAEPLLVPTYQVLKEKRGERDYRAQWALERVHRLYRAWGKPEEASRHR